MARARIANAIWAQAVLVAVLIMLGQSGTSVRGACNVLIEMMVVVAFVPPPEEGRPAVAVLKVAGMTGILLVLGASLYGIGNLRARRKSATVRSNAIE